MTILAVAQQVALLVGIARPLTVFASTDREMQEMQTIANEAAVMIAEAFDWQALLQVQTLTGDGATEAFDLASDFKRMPATANLWSSRFRDDFDHITRTDDWLALDLWPIQPVRGAWTIFGGQIHVRPRMGVGETARFFYVRNDIVTGVKPAFDNDNDAFRLDERLLKLAMVYLWKQQKGQDFTAELSDYEMALTKATDRDGGSKPILSGNLSRMGRGRMGNVWLGTLGSVS